MVRAGKKWGADIYKKKKGKKTRSFAGLLVSLVFPTPLMHFSQVHMKKKVTEKCCILTKFCIKFFKIFFRAVQCGLTSRPYVMLFLAALPWANSNTYNCITTTYQHHFSPISVLYQLLIYHRKHEYCSIITCIFFFGFSDN